MESIAPFLLLIVIILVIVQWIKSANYLKHGGTKNLKDHGVETVKFSGKNTASEPVKSSGKNTKPEPEKKKVTRRARPGPYPGIEKGKRIIFGGVELKSLDKEIAEDIEGRSDVNLVFDIEPDDHRYAGAFAVWAEGPRINDFVGYLPKDVAQTIREYGIIDDLTVRVDYVWIGDRGGAFVRVNIDGPPSIIEQMQEQNTSSRVKKETKKPHYFEGYPTFEYQTDINLLKSRKDFDSLETLLKNLTDAESKNPSGPAPYTFQELAMLYRKLKRYQDEVEILEQYTLITFKHGRPGRDFSQRIEKARQLAQKGSQKK